jgi:hypothetical protein
MNWIFNTDITKSLLFDRILMQFITVHILATYSIKIHLVHLIFYGLLSGFSLLELYVCVYESFSKYFNCIASLL